MQLKTIIFILLVLTVLMSQAEAQTANLDELERQVRAMTGLKTGNVRTSSPGCADGMVMLLKIPEYRTITFSLNARMLIGGLRNTNEQVKLTARDRQCYTEMNTTITGSHIEFSNVETCTGFAPNSVTVSLDSNKRGFTFRKNENGTIQECEYFYSRN